MKDYKSDNVQGDNITKRKAMSLAVAFFWQHASTSYDPKTETRAQGRRRGAESLASAEAWAVEQGMTFTWEADYYGDSLVDMNHATDDNREGWCEADCGKTHEVFAAVARYRDGSVAGSLGGVIDPTRDYCRVVNAELASEARSEAMTLLLEAI